MILKLKVLKMDGAKIPSYAKKGDAGLDLFSNEETVLKSGERKMVKTGIKMEIPEGCVGLIWDKSGLAASKGIKTMGGVIDSGYRGEIQVVLHNLGSEDFVIERGMKIAQIIIQKFEEVEVEEVEVLSESERGENNFGSTGLK